MIIAQVVQGLAYLNQAPRHIIHYDLKPANILFDALGQAKITVRQTLEPSPEPWTLPPSFCLRCPVAAGIHPVCICRVSTNL